MVVADYEVLAVTHGPSKLDGLVRQIRSLGNLAKAKLDPEERKILLPSLKAFVAACDYGHSILQARTLLATAEQTVCQEATFLGRFFGDGKDIIQLVVSGRHMATLLSTLTFCKSSYLAARFGGAWTPQDGDVEEGGAWFDQDPDLMEAVLLHTRMDSLLGRCFRPRPFDQKCWFEHVKYFGLESAFEQPDSELLGSQYDDLLALLGEANSWNIRFDLLFRASRDGFSSQAFHQKCDGKGPTVVLAKSIEGHLFGGYTETSWDSSCRYKQSEQAFLFRLAGPEGSRIRPSKHPVTNPSRGIYCHPTSAARFGGGGTRGDMCICQAESAAQVYFGVGHSYSLESTSTEGGSFRFLAESARAVVADYEVFTVTALI